MVSLGSHFELRESSRKWSSKVSVECSDAAEWKLEYGSAKYIEQLIYNCVPRPKNCQDPMESEVLSDPNSFLVRTPHRQS